jgi:hypothetical protein
LKHKRKIENKMIKIFFLKSWFFRLIKFPFAFQTSIFDLRLRSSIESPPSTHVCHIIQLLISKIGEINR